jgi:hypothetical protein
VTAITRGRDGARAAAPDRLCRPPKDDLFIDAALGNGLN